MLVLLKETMLFGNLSLPLHLCSIGVCIADLGFLFCCILLGETCSLENGAIIKR